MKIFNIELTRTLALKNAATELKLKTDNEEKLARDFWVFMQDNDSFTSEQTFNTAKHFLTNIGISSPALLIHMQDEERLLFGAYLKAIPKRAFNNLFEKLLSSNK